MLAKYIQVILTVILLCTLACGQVKDSKKFSRLRVSDDLRERLVGRFNLFVEYERTGQYEKQYDLLSSEDHDFLNFSKVTRNNYPEYKRELASMMGELLELKVTGFDRKLNDGRWIGISVRAKLHKGNKTYSDEPLMVAELQGKDWFFSFHYVAL